MTDPGARSAGGLLVLWRLLAVTWASHRRASVLVFGSALVVAAGPLVLAACISRLVTERQSSFMMTVLLLGIVGSVLLVLVATCLGRPNRVALLDALSMTLDLELMDAVNGVRDLGVLEEEHFSNLIQNVRGQLGRIANAGVALMTALVLVFQAVAALVSLLFVAPPIAALLVVTFVASALFSRQARKHEVLGRRAISRPLRRAGMLASLCAADRGLDEIYANRCEEFVLTRHGEMLSKAETGEKAMAANVARFSLAAAVMVAMGMVTSVILAFVLPGVSAANAVYTVAAMSSFSGVAGAIVQNGGAVFSAIDAWGSLSRLVSVSGPRREGVSATGRQSVEFRGAGYRYPGAASDALVRFELALPKTGLVFVTGPNGAGKSTFTDLLAGLRKQHGDGSVIGAPQWSGPAGLGFGEGMYVRVVPQAQCAYNLALRECIQMGDLEYQRSDAELCAALRLADASLEGLDLDRLDAQIGTDGGRRGLSGGQWQKIGLARGLLRADAALVILDEPSSAIDPGSEDRIIANVDRLRRQRPSCLFVVVGHHPAFMRLADLVVVVDRGMVVDSGPPAEVASRPGYVKNWLTASYQLYGGPSK